MLPFRPVGLAWRAGEIVATTVGMVGLFVMVASVLGIETAVCLVVFIALLVFRIRWAALGKFDLRTDPRLQEQYIKTLPREAVGPHELELTEDYLIERTPYSERHIPLEDIKEARSVGDHSYLSIEPGRGCVIPHQAATEGNVQTFVEAIRMRVSEISAEPDAADVTMNVKARPPE